MTAIYGRSQIKVYADEQVHSAWSSLMVTHQSSNRGRHALTSVNVPLSYILGRHRKLHSLHWLCQLAIASEDYQLMTDIVGRQLLFIY